MASQYRIFQKGISLIPKAATLDGPYNSIKGDLELLSSTNKLYFHNGTINDPVVQENVAATLANKTLTAPVINNATADTITGIAGGSLTVQSASNQNLSLQAQGTGTVTLESLTVDGSNVSASTDIAFNQTSGNTYFKVTGTNVVRIDSDGIAFLNKKDAKFYDATNTGYVNVEASTSTATYPITLPAAAPTANTALVYDGTQYKWGAAGGADSAGANDDILATAFRARILDSFDDAPSASSSTINGTTSPPSSVVTTALHVPNNQLYAIQYQQNSITSGGTTANPVLGSAAPVWLAIGDVIVVNNLTTTEARRVTSISPLTIESPFFSVASGSCVISQTVTSKELYQSTFDGDSIADAFSTSPFSEYLIDYQDSATTVYQANVQPKISYSVSQDSISWSAADTRPQDQTSQIQSGTFANPGTALYVRLFANTNVSGSGTINLLEYRAYMQKSPIVASGVVNQAYARFDGSISPQNCTVSTVLGKTRITLTTWTYSTGVNTSTPANTYGAIDVYINGQFIPRQVSTYLTSGAFYKEISSSIIELDTDYSATAYAIQIIQRQPMGNFTSSSGGSSSSTGSGLKNYLTTYNNNTGNGNFETGDTTGWSLFNTTLTNFIPTGSINAGAASITTFSAVATTPLAGNYSLSVVSGSLTAGQGFITNAFTIDREDRAKVLAFNFSYEVVSGSSMNFSGTTANTWAIYLHDGTNWIQPAGVYGMVQSSGAGYVTGTFQTSSTATQYRLAVVCINGSVAGSLKFDDFFVGPQVSANAPAMNDWQSYTPTFTGFGTVSTQTFWWRRNGDTIQIKGRFAAGTSTATEARISLPFSLVSDSTKVNGTSEICGMAQPSDVNSSTTGGIGATFNVLIEPSQNYVTFASRTSTNGGLTKLNAINIATGGTALSLFAELPIVGWSSNTVASADTDTRVVCANVNTSTTSIGTSDTLVVFTNVVNDTHGTYSTSTGRYTVPVSGFYKVTSYLTITSLTLTTGQSFGSNLYLDGVFVKPLSVTLGNGASNAYRTYGSAIVYANAGQILDIRAFNSVTSTALTSVTIANNNASFERLSGPAVVQATESVNAYYTSTSTASIPTSTTLFTYATKAFDTHNAYNSGVYTAPVSGKYQITAQYSSNSSTICSNYVTIVKNTSTVVAKGAGTRVAAVGSEFLSQITSIVNLNAGETIQINTFSTQAGQTYTGDSTTMFFAIARIGN